jgi:hypothetical protein
MAFKYHIRTIIMKEKKEVKSFQVRLPRETWEFLKKNSVDTDKSMMGIILGCVEKYKKRCEKKLTEK